jgi:hypothetical protein
VQLDNTRIAVRERNLLETFDLALHVVREFWRPWLACSLLAIVPLAVLNYALIGWMADIDYVEDVVPFRFYWTMTVLIYLEAPLASTLAIGFLGPAVFLERPSIRQVLREVMQFAPQLTLCQLLLRGILPVWLLLLTLDQYEVNIFVEVFLIPGIAIYATVIRALRPNITEIILLEKNPLRAKNANQLTIGKRSAHLHDPSASDLFGRWIGSALLAMLLVGIVFTTLSVAVGVLFSQWMPGWYAAQFLFPAALWTVAAFITVVRFLNYLDLRIRHEGWEVELLMRAEGIRLAGK